MKAIKKLTAICLAGAMVTSVVACGSPDDTKATDSAQATDAGSESTAKTADEASSSDAPTPTEYIQDTGEAALVVNGQEYSKMLYDYETAAITANADPASVSGLVEEHKDAVIKQMIVAQYFTDTATDAEKAEVQELATASYDDMIQQVMLQMMQQGQLTMTGNETKEEMVAQTEDLYAQSWAEQGMSVQTIKDSLLLNQNYQKGLEKIKNEIDVTEDEEKKWYDDQVLQQRQEFSSNPGAFDDLMKTDPPSAVTAPEGYAYYKHVLIGLSEEENTKAQALQGELGELVTELTETLSQVKPDQAKITDLETKIAAKRAEILQSYAATTAKAEEVLAKIAAGEDFDALIVEYGEDPGMTEEPGKTTGYLIGPGTVDYITEFKNGATSLGKVGDTSDLVYSSFGIHIIKRIKDVPAGDFEFAEVRDLSKSGVQLQELQEVADAKTTELLEKAKVEDLTK